MVGESYRCGQRLLHRSLDGRKHGTLQKDAAFGMCVRPQCCQIEEGSGW